MMAPLTEIVVAVVAHSSAVAFSHFGVVLEPPAKAERPQAAVQRVVARTPASRPQTERVPADKGADGPEARQPQKQPQARA